MLKALFRCGTLGPDVGGPEVVATLNKLGKAGSWPDFAIAAHHFSLDKPENRLLKLLEATARLIVDDKSERGLALVEELSESAKSPSDWNLLLDWTRGVEQSFRRMNWAQKYQTDFPTSADAWEFLGDEYLDQHEGEEALQAYSRAHSLHEEVDIGLLEKIVECHQMLGDRLQSVAVLAEICQLDPLNPERWRNLSNEYLDGPIKDPRQSEYCFKKIAAIRPHDWKDWFFRAHALDRANDIQEALDACFCGLELEAHNLHLLTFLAHLLQRLGQLQHRKEVLQLIAKLDPDATWVFRELAEQCAVLLDRPGMSEALAKMRYLDPEALLKLERWIADRTIQ